MSTPTVQVNGNTVMAASTPEDEPKEVFYDAPSERPPPTRKDTTYSKYSTMSVPPEGALLTGKQEHYLKRELLSQQAKFEIAELSSPTALQRFGAPFRSDKGEVAPSDSDLPILRYIFVHHVRNFPFLDKAREKEFWQDKLQTFLESFANKNISSSEDRLEETKRRKLALKAEKLVELMMVSGIPTASGYEERIRFSEIEIVERGANENGFVINAPSGHAINGWDVNVAGVRRTSVKRHLRYHTHAEYLIRVRQQGGKDYYVGRRYTDFVNLHKRIRLELPGKVLPPHPRKNKKDSVFQSTADDDDSSISSASTQDAPLDPYEASGGGLRSYLFSKRNTSATSVGKGGRSPRASSDNIAYREPRVLYREEQRVSLRAFLRTFLQNDVIARSNAMAEFLTRDPIEINEEEMEDIERRMEMDAKRMEEQKRFYEVARQRAAELDIHMEKFRREIVEANGLSHLFQEIRVKNTIGELKPEYKKFAEWLRIEVAATLYHLFLAEDNSPELFAQLKRIHSLTPYTVLKNVIRIANPAAVMSGVLDLFLAQPFGARSLLQRMFGMAINDGVRSVQKALDTLASTKIKDDVLCAKLKAFVDADNDVKDLIRQDAESQRVDIAVAVLQSEYLQPELSAPQIEKVFNSYVAWNSAVENVRGNRLSRKSSGVSGSGDGVDVKGDVRAAQMDAELRNGAELFAHLKQYLKLCMRQRDKIMMLQIIEEPTTLHLFRDLFTIFYEPLVRVYKSANVYNSITDFALFVDDTIAVISACQRQDISSDPNQTVQAFIDLCARHEDNFYKFVHEVHIHDNGLFDQLMGWLEGILEFLRHGPKGGGKLDMNELFRSGVEAGVVEEGAAKREINGLIRWQHARKKWHQDKTRQKMASGGGEPDVVPGGILAEGLGGFKTSDFGLNELDIQDLELDDDANYSSDESDIDDEDISDPIEAERKRRLKLQEKLRRTAGEPKKPPVEELQKLHPRFVDMLRSVLAE